MAASSSGPGWKYGVFLNFTGKDTLDGFVCHLDKALRQKSIDTFIHAEKLRECDHHLSEHLIAIRESRLLLVVFSENYASSTRCLKELVEIVQRNGTKEQIMVPIFYQVDPSHVRKLSGSFGEAFARHDTEMDEVRSWRSALTTAADFSGWVSRDFGDDAELIEKIVEDVYGKLTHGSPASIEYDVFINFRGEDTRRGFVSHLYSALHQNPISTYIDAKALRKGDPLSKLVKAAGESKISLLVISENYASSTFVLKELVEIAESNYANNQIVIPIFYKVNPSDVRNLRRSFEEAFLKHYNDSIAEVQRWRSALTSATNLSGGLSHPDQNDAELIKNIVEDVSQKLISIASTSSEYDVFINFRGQGTREGFVSHLYSALRQNSINTVIDAEALMKGDDLSKLLLAAARKSKISLIVISENYTSSTWCLKELVEIAESNYANNQIVIPIFYKVNPSDVRNVRRSFEEAFAKHYNDSCAEVQRWSFALTSIADKSGWDSQYYRNDAELIKEIVEEVSQKLIRIASTSSEYDVFINFRGADTRKVFVSHLYSALRQNSINTIDAEALRKGDDLSKVLIAARESKISLIVISENYASSAGCLKELVEIAESSYANNHIMLPIFYKVNPSDVQSWRSALTSATNLSGWASHPNENDAELIEKIVEGVSMELIRIASTSSKSNGLIEMDSRMHEMHLLLHPPGVETNDVCVVGILGTGGLGKTTIARAVYDEIADRFEAACFFEIVKEGFMKLGKLHMQAQLLDSFLGNKWTADRFEASLLLENVKSYRGFYKIRMQARLQQSILDHEVGSSYISNKSFQMMLERIGKRKVLLVVDNVDKVAQIEALLGKQHSFGGGSKIIITTRDAQLLSGVDAIYEPKIFSDPGALELFRWYAFRTNQPTTDYDDLSRRVIEYAQGLPLALKVLGAFLYNKTVHEWEDVLEKLRKIPERKIHDVLQTSFDGLDDITKDIFLDIACFFRGMNVDSAVEIMGKYDMIGIHPCLAIRVLMDRALITVSRWGDLEMHDSLEEMGREIVRQESLKEPERQSRLRRYEDVDLESWAHKSPNDISSHFGRMPLQPMSIVLTDAKAVYAIIERSW